ncbi:phosphate metabolism protein 7, partial [Spiromyces aspiralis]
MSNYGDATNLDNNNFHTLSSSLMINGGALCGIYLGFSLLRRIFDSIYSPRCQLAKMNKRFKRLPKDYMSLLSWLSPKVIIPSPSNPHEYVQLKGKVARREIINRTSLDTYMFLRMMKMLFSLFSLLCILSVGVLLPINYFGGNGKTGVDRFTMNNIKPGSKLLWAHVIYAMLFIMAMLGCIMSELSRYIRERRKYLRRVKDKTKSTTLLISTIPKGYNRQRELRNIFSNFRDGVADIYINMDL